MLPQVCIIKNHPNNGTTTTTHPSLYYLERKVQEDKIIKQNLRNKVKVLTKQLNFAHEELVTFLNECDKNDKEFSTKVSQMAEDHTSAIKQLKEDHLVVLVEKSMSVL